ncbi:MAG: hypothetical protein WCO06_00470 [Candidatus Roizmanbacteria bacterium]
MKKHYTTYLLLAISFFLVIASIYITYRLNNSNISPTTAIDSKASGVTYKKVISLSSSVLSEPTTIIESTIAPTLEDTPIIESMITITEVPTNTSIPSPTSIPSKIKRLPVTGYFDYPWIIVVAGICIVVFSFVF